MGRLIFALFAAALLAAPAAAGYMDGGECVHSCRESCPTVHFDAKGRPVCGGKVRPGLEPGECAGAPLTMEDFRADDIEPEGLEDYARWRYAHEPVPDELLDTMTASMLRVFRNTFFAGHGRVFKDRRLDAYFRGFAWYKPRRDFRESDLGAVEKANAAKAAKKEAELRKFAAENGGVAPALMPFVPANEADDHARLRGSR